MKRGRTTMMITVDLASGSTTDDLKGKLEPLVGRERDEQQLLLECDNGDDKRTKILEDGRELTEQGVKNDAVIYLVLKDGDKWGEVDIPNYLPENSQ